jgi:hypothetical protein
VEASIVGSERAILFYEMRLCERPGTSRFLRAICGLTSVIALAAAPACSSADDAEAGGVPNPNGKDEGAACVDGNECKSLGCSSGKCTPVTNLTSCSGAACVTGTPTDGVKNGDETDVDCGGAKAPKCAVGKGCNADADCTSDACSYAKKCVDAKTCTGHFGGDTCGAGETGAADEKHESCCATVTTKAGLRLGKYAVTSGRMRAFVGRTNGNVKGWVTSANPKGWNSAWTAELPSSMDEALVALGPNNKRGCNIEFRGARTYWQPNLSDTEKNDFPQDVLDEKAQQCVSWIMAQAFCAFEGGRLIASTEIAAQQTNEKTTSWPWGNSPGFNVKAQSDQLVHMYSYLTPNPPKDMRTAGNDPFDQSFFIAPPGRRPLGGNQIGMQDVMGNTMPWVNDGKGKFAWMASWEAHEAFNGGTSTLVGTWPPKDTTGGEADGYYALGIRCAYP